MNEDRARFLSAFGLGFCQRGNHAATSAYEYDGVTWCQHRIHDSDIEYVRAERIAALEAALEQARVALELYRGQVNNIGTHTAADALRKIEEARRG